MGDGGIENVADGGTRGVGDTLHRRRFFILAESIVRRSAAAAADGGAPAAAAGTVECTSSCDRPFWMRPSIGGNRPKLTFIG
jgi:hypothetical protein